MSTTFGAIRYVDNQARGSNDGSSWANAWTNFLYLDRSSNKVSYGDTVYIAARDYADAGVNSTNIVRLKEGNVSGGATNWTSYFFTNGPATIYCGLYIYNYTRINGGANDGYTTNIVGTYDVARITNNINLFINRTNAIYNVGSYGRSITALSIPVSIRWVHCRGAHRVDSPPSDTPSEISVNTASGNHGGAEVAYCWIDGAGGRGSSSNIGLTLGGDDYPLGYSSIHHCLIENLETDIFTCSGGTDIHHNIVRNRYGQRGGCNDTFVLCGSASNIRVYNNLIEPSDNALYYWPSTTVNLKLHDLYFYGNLMRPVDPSHYWTNVAMSTVGDPDMRCDNISVTGTTTLSSNIFWLHNTIVSQQIGGPKGLISFGVPDGVLTTYSVQPGAFVVENNLFSCVDTTRSIPAQPLNFYAYNITTGHNTNSGGFGWSYGRDSIIIDRNVFDTYTAGYMQAVQWGSSPDQPLSVLTNATQIASVLGYFNNISLTNAIFSDAPHYDYHPSSSAVNIGQNLATWTNLMPDIDKDLYGAPRGVSGGWSVGAIQYQAIAPTAPGISMQPVGQTNTAGGSATFVVAATGTAPLGYQWRFYGLPIVGATGANFTRSNITFGDAGDYSVIVSSAYGAVTSIVARLTVLTVPSISTDPLSQTNTVGDNVTFAVGATGSPPLSYQWLFNGNPAVGATGASYTLTNVTQSDAGAFSVIVANPYGAVTSALATLTVRNVGGVVGGSVTNGLLCWLTFEDNFPAQGYAEDASGHGARMLRYGWGTSKTNFPTIGAGKVGLQAASFLPYYDTHPFSTTNYWTGQYGAITNVGGLTTLTQATIAAWVKFANVGTASIDMGKNHTGTILDTGYGVRGAWHFGRYYSDPYGEPLFMIMTNKSGIQSSWQLDFPQPAKYYFYTNNTWWHFAVTVDCSNPTNLSATLYTNGVAYSTRTLALAAADAVPYLTMYDPQPAAWGPWIAVGCWTHGGTPPLDDADQVPNNGWLQGDLDDIRIYNRVLSSAEMNQVYSGQVTGGGGRPSRPRGVTVVIASP